MILIDQLAEEESQTQESILLNSILQNLHSNWNINITPHLSCLSAFIKSREKKPITIEDASLWHPKLLKSYHLLCEALEKMFPLVDKDIIDSSVYNWNTDN